jgi:hypothetical protein
VAHTPSDGPLGLEGRHEFRGGAEFGGPLSEFGVFMYGKRQAFGTSYIKIDRITGLLGLGDADDFRQAAEGRSGEIIYPSAQRGRTLVYEGRVIAPTLPELRQLVQDFRRAAAESRERYAGSITIVDPADTGQGYGTGIRTMALDLDEEQSFGPTRLPSPWIRSFSLGVRMHDPRFVWYPEQEDLANAAGATQVVANEGNAPAEVSILVRATGDPMDVVIENLTTGKMLTFVDLPMPAVNDRRLWVPFIQRAAVRPDAAEPAFTPNSDMMPYMDLDNSDWWNALEWGLAPGNNSIKVSGTNVGTWDVFWQHTSY